MEVQKHLGNGFQEVIYQRASAIELGLSSLEFKREFEMPIMYKGHQIGTRRVDFLINGNISVGMKAVTQNELLNLAQELNYLEAYKLD